MQLRLVKLEKLFGDMNAASFSVDYWWAIRHASLKTEVYKRH